ncbi:MAG TPA: hypothetical protein VGQ81_07225 [Acidobacteriota bacterium]|jgi:hypothetical protein|nr:hypothetical protein [Acidobacteriota bacterium]
MRARAKQIFVWGLVATVWTIALAAGRDIQKRQLVVSVRQLILEGQIDEIVCEMSKDPELLRRNLAAITSEPELRPVLVNLLREDPELRHRFESLLREACE